MKELLSNDYFVLCAMAVIICCFTQLLKIPIKTFTNNIKDKKTEDRVTALLMLLPLVLGVLFNFLYNTYYLQITFSVVQGLSLGTTSIAFYQGFKKVITGKELTEKEIEQTKNVTTLVEDITKDNKIDKNDASALSEYLKKIK
jgi:hypothetical protein